MQKYSEAVVRKSSGLQILAEIDHFEISSRVSKNTDLFIGIIHSKKTTKLYCFRTEHTLPYSPDLLITSPYTIPAPLNTTRSIPVRISVFFVHFPWICMIFGHREPRKTNENPTENQKTRPKTAKYQISEQQNRYQLVRPYFLHHPDDLQHH